MPQSIWSSVVQDVIAQAQSSRTASVTVENDSIDIPVPFPSPEDWRDVLIYQVLVDRFNNPNAPPRRDWDREVGEFQGGTFNGIKEQLSYLQQMGVGAIWLSPVMKNCQYSDSSYHGYGIQDFLTIDPRLASAPDKAEEELQNLINESHARGMYVIFDIVLNHAGDVFEYQGHGSTAPWKNDPYLIRWRDEQGLGRPDWVEAPKNQHPDAAVWPTELCHNASFRRQGEGGEAGGDFASLKELVTELKGFSYRDGHFHPVRNALIRAHQYLIAKFDVDGFRIDTLKYIERDFAQVFGNAMREFALSIGKKNFFTFGEVYDNEEKIAGYIGRFATESSDLVGVDAALDFPLFYVLPQVAKGLTAPSGVIRMFLHRKEVQRGLLSSHGEASRFFVTFLDNHDQHQRVRYSAPPDLHEFDDQVILGIGCLLTLQGIPCLYYGTEQGLHGRGRTLEAVREALWGKENAFDRTNAFYQAIRQIAEVRRSQPALRYGRQYFRPVSGDGLHFGISHFPAGVLAYSRILNDQEVIVAANTNTSQSWTGETIVDYALNPVGTPYRVLYSNKKDYSPPGQVEERPIHSVEIHEVNGIINRGPARALRLQLQRMEIQVLAK